MHKQRGFIQNFIIPGIILIGVVIAGIAMLASNSGGSDFSNEKAAMVANSVIGNSLTISGAIQRAEADGAVMTPGLQTSADSVLVTGKYMTALPQVPKELSSLGIYYSTGELDVIYGADVNLGGPGNVPALKDDVLLIDLGAGTAAEETCKRITSKTANVPVNGASLATVQPDHIRFHTDNIAGAQEGCGYAENSIFGPGVRYAYYKVMKAKGNPDAPSGSGGGGSPAP